MDAPERRTAEHLHGMAAGSLTVLALFFLLALPLALRDIILNGPTRANLTLPALFLGFALGAMHEARRWHGRVQTRVTAV